MTTRKFYVVWEGRAPGIYDSWDECKLQIDNYPGARYRSFPDQESATAAFRGNPSEHIGTIAKIARRQLNMQDNARRSEILPDAIAVDGASSGNPGPIEYRGVRVSDGSEIFHVGPLQGGTNNIAEYLALVHALAYLDKLGLYNVAIYSDSVTALSWLRHRACRTKISWNSSNEQLHSIVVRADAWLASHAPRNPILKWNTERWGEIPADFGRKK